jgi:hypothetical protein
MKKRQLTRFLTKKFYYLPLIFLFIANLGSGCQKSSQSDPCDGVLNEGTPTQVGLIFLDGQTGENILLSKSIDTSAITITPEPMDLKRGVIVKQPGAPLDGALVFLISDTKEGTFKYKIDITNVGSATLSYTNKEEKTNDKCKSYYISTTDPKIEDHSFTVSRTSSRIIFKVTL